MLPATQVEQLLCELVGSTPRDSVCVSLHTPILIVHAQRNVSDHNLTCLVVPLLLRLLWGAISTDADVLWVVPVAVDQRSG